MRTNPNLGCAILAILALTACGGDGYEPTTPDYQFAVSALSGTYTVDLTPGGLWAAVNPYHSCQQVRVTIGPSSSWEVLACAYKGIQPGSVEIKADTVILNLATTSSGSDGVQLRGFRFGGFTGTADRAETDWTGGRCVLWGGLGQACEGGTAAWHR